MIKIGILGADNSHALNFAKLVNLGTGYDDVKITHIYGIDNEQAKSVATNGGIENICLNPSEMVGNVDAVMVVFRDGALHYEYALPYIKLGIPVWVDKPIATDSFEALEMIEEAKKSGSLLLGGSCCKLVPDIKEVKDYASAHKIKFGSLNFPIYLDSPYSGIHFYAAHLIEMMTEVFGYEIVSVYSHKNLDNLTVIAEYAGFDFVLAFSPTAGKFRYNLIGEQENYSKDINISPLTKCGMDDFISCIKSGKTTYPMDNLYKVTKITNSISESMQKGKKVMICY